MNGTTGHAHLWDGGPGWLNTASYGLPPRAAWDALQGALDEWRTGGADWETWDRSTDRARRSFARLVGAEVSDVAVGSTVAAALAPVATALPDDAVVLVDETEFTSAVFPWQVHASRGVRVVSTPGPELVDAIRPGVDVVSVSAVQSSTGAVLDLPAVVAACEEAGARLVLDASQAAGWLPLDVSGVDVLVAHSYKWMMSPRGATFCYLSSRIREELRPLNASWYAAADVMGSYYGTRMDLASDARRFDQSPAWFSLVGAAAALEVIEEIGVPVIHAHDVALANRFRAGLGLPPGSSAVVSTYHPGSQEAFADAGLRAAVRNDRLRVSFHVYNTDADVDLALDALSGADRAGRGH
ncbi:MAG TPA: aminotransferase class V-fold PLP-dependent enzyme [Nocardioides sp.]|uniref:aminotransferase class V-fold PLP-dependent enzyme n=1 Tax=Nocardioides sp. TaxID=35761 RepID=UPI002E381BF9|nr:aminotransferase class V-fold PLP-dependent enzyme [Nocardioides sp.]HEX5088903.1 aminotransferase class V-fold PLP-dependent enzyme [Nocardioides sp.]